MRPHDLVELDPAWIRSIDDPRIRLELERVPWAVVRRMACAEGSIAIGVRGTTRAQRWPLVAPQAAIRSHIQPESLARAQPRRNLPALLVLTTIRSAAQSHGLCFGPVGSVGFELASGAAVVHAQSDCDIIVRGFDSTRRALAEFAETLGACAVRIDVQIECGTSGVALDEYLRSGERVMAKTPHGPQLLARADFDCA